MEGGDGVLGIFIVNVVHTEVGCRVLEVMSREENSMWRHDP